MLSNVLDETLPQAVADEKHKVAKWQNISNGMQQEQQQGCSKIVDIFPAFWDKKAALKSNKVAGTEFQDVKMGTIARSDCSLIKLFYW